MHNKHTHDSISKSILNQYKIFFKNPTDDNLKTIRKLSKLFIQVTDYDKIRLKKLNNRKYSVRQTVQHVEKKYNRNPSWATKAELNLARKKYVSLCIDIKNIVKLYDISITNKIMIKNKRDYLVSQLHDLQNNYTKNPTIEAKNKIQNIILDLAELSTARNLISNNYVCIRKSTKLSNNSLLPTSIKSQSRLIRERNSLQRNIKKLETIYVEDPTRKLYKELTFAYKCLKEITIPVRPYRDPKLTHKEKQYAIRNKLRIAIAELIKKYNENPVQKNKEDLEYARMCLKESLIGIDVTSKVKKIKTPQHLHDRRVLTYRSTVLRHLIREYKSAYKKNPSIKISRMLQTYETKLNEITAEIKNRRPSFIIWFSDDDRKRMRTLGSARHSKKNQIIRYVEKIQKY